MDRAGLDGSLAGSRAAVWRPFHECSACPSANCSTEAAAAHAPVGRLIAEPVTQPTRTPATESKGR